MIKIHLDAKKNKIRRSLASYIQKLLHGGSSDFHEGVSLLDINLNRE